MKPFRLIPILRISAAYLFGYLPLRFSLLFLAPFSGYSKAKIGKCELFAPPKQMHILQEGITYLQTCDPEMYRRLTEEREYRFWYSSKQRYLQVREIFSLTDNFLGWGKEGVAVFFVQCILEFNLRYLPMVRTLDWTVETGKAARREVQKQVFDWLLTRSFPPELVKQYEMIAEAA